MASAYIFTIREESKKEQRGPLPQDKRVSCQGLTSPITGKEYGSGDTAARLKANASMRGGAMSKKPVMTQEEVQQYVDSYSDFSFEVKTLSLLAASGFSCSHSGTYTDPVTGKTREYDIRATKVDNAPGIGYYELQLPVECKNFKPQSPLVVHRLPRRREESTHDLVVNTGKNRGRVTVPPPFSLYQKGNLTGKSVDQLRRNGGAISGSDSEVFDKVSQALCSAHEMVQVAASGHGNFIVSSVIPILVIPEGSLWVIDYDENGNVVNGPEAVQQTAYYCGKTWSYPGQPLSAYSLSHLEIVTIDYLQEFVRCLYVDQDDLIDLLKKELLLA